MIDRLIDENVSRGWGRGGGERGKGGGVTEAGTWPPKARASDMLLAGWLVV